MKYKVCVLAAGSNDRVGHAKEFNIVLLPIGTKSTLTRIIEKFPSDIEIVIATGFKAELVKEFVKVAYPERNITIVEVENFSGPGSGPGLSLLACKEHLQAPFIFTSADTLVREAVPEPNRNWIGVARVGNSRDYLMADTDHSLVRQFFVKVETDVLLRTCQNYEKILDNAFIGMAGICDYETFWQGMELNKQLIRNEFQVSNGLSEIIPLNVETIPFTWFDTGNEAGYNYACRFFDKNRVIIKPDEFLYFENGKVIKYFANKHTVEERIKRAEKLEGIVPPLTFKGHNFYAYDFIEAQTLPKVTDPAIFESFLEYCNETVWKKIDLTKEQKVEFKKQCEKFYVEKTRNRIEKFLNGNGVRDREEIINSKKIPKTSELLDKVDWNKLCEGVPVLFHGDLQPENILICDNGFRLIDWRQNFAGNVEYGDIYYDFAKLHHALIITHEVIRKNEFEIKEKGDIITYNFMQKNNLREYLEIFENFLVKEGYDLQKVRVLSALTYLNIAPLHHHPYNHFLYYYGKSMLHKALRGENGGA
ncbi:phosphotransferase [Candidatus Woesearchaeota archaeon]|nr:phosphotransferase [Candidatus Woesearchaeota archaeon]